MVPSFYEELQASGMQLDMTIFQPCDPPDIDDSVGAQR
jgi:hypothetical protein